MLSKEGMRLRMLEFMYEDSRPEAVRQCALVEKIPLNDAEKIVRHIEESLCLRLTAKPDYNNGHISVFHYLRYWFRYLSDDERIFAIMNFILFGLSLLFFIPVDGQIGMFLELVAKIAFFMQIFIFSWLTLFVSVVGYLAKEFTLHGLLVTNSVTILFVVVPLSFAIIVWLTF